jgi:hypothetical protein
MKLNGWQRIGVVLSIVWVVGAAIYQRNVAVERAANFAASTYEICSDIEQRKPESDSNRCIQESAQTRARWLYGNWNDVIFSAFAPMLLAWPAIYLLIRVWRWVRAGFKTKGMEIEQ